MLSKNYKNVKGVKVRERKSTILKNIKLDTNKFSHARHKYTLNILNALTNPTATRLSSVKGTKCTLNTLNISKK